MVDIVSGIGALNGAITMVKQLRDVQTKVGEQEVRARLIDINDELLNAKESLQEAKAKTIELQARVQELESTKNLREMLIKREDTYVPQNGALEGYGEGPWCTLCFDSEEKLINMHSKSHHIGPGVQKVFLQCPKCNSMST